MNDASPTKWAFWRIDLAGLALCLLGAAIFYFAGIRPLLARRDSTAAHTRHLEILRKKAVQIADNSVSLKKTLAEARAALKTNTLQLQSSGGINGRIALLADLAAAEGLKVDEIQPGQTIPTSQFKIVPIALLGSGNYPICAAFLHKLAETFPDTSVDSFELAGDPQNPTTGIRFRIQLLWHTAPDRVAITVK